jgi:DNA-binding NtrC family response regulator
LRREGQFREDFFYRLCSDVITVPSLRQRLREEPGEMELLLRHLVARLTGHDSPGLAEEMRKSLEKSPGRDYPWPGNVRELEQAVRRILIVGRYEGSQPAAGPAAELQAGIEAGTMDAATLLAAYSALLHKRYGTYEEVARRLNLDRRTVKKYVQARRA